MAETTDSVFQPTIASALSLTREEILVFPHGFMAIMGFGKPKTSFAISISLPIHSL
jgi:hypothetical protein